MRALVGLVISGTFILFLNCNHKSSSNNSDCNNGGTEITVESSAGNVQPIEVNGGPVSSQIYPNGLFISVTICQPGSTTNCQTIDGILLDTGS